MNEEHEEHKEINLNNIISNVSFGFWVDFFNLNYKNIFGNKLIKAFNLDLDPNFIYRKLIKVKNKIRNRIAHRENMIKYDIMNNYGTIMQLVSFIDKDIAKYVDEKSEVKKLYNKNKTILEEYRKMCSNKNDTKIKKKNR